jgi:hypothetical protein
MYITKLWHPGLRIIEFGATDGALGEGLSRAGYHQFLAVARSEAVAARLAKRHPGLHSRLTSARIARAVRQNNGEVLVLNRGSGLHLGRFRSLRHASWIAVPVRPTPWLIVSVLLGLIQWMLGRITPPLLLTLSDSRGKTVRLLTFGVRRRQERAARRFVPHVLGVERFLRRLERAGLRHAVLRWFETLPTLPPGEDLDLLVDDADLDSVSALLDEGPGLQPVDLYSTTGLPGADYRRMPYFPPYVAEQILTRAELRRGLCRVPSPEDHFLSLAYHALYHKGTKSGLPQGGTTASNVTRVEHDYTNILRRLAAALGIEVPITLADLDAYLDARNWRPPHDMLVRLGRRNAWLRSRVAAERDHGDPGLSVFLLRAAALARGGEAKATALLERHGFVVVRTHTIAAEQVSAVARSIRGGNWGAGPWPASGGPPAVAIVAYDTDPIRPSRRDRRKFPFLVNARLLAKNKVRDAFNEGLPPSQHCNVVHSSDNGREALDYLRTILPHAVHEVLAEVARLRSSYRTAEPVIATSTRFGRRAKIEVVERDGRLAVKKTFKPHQERFCQREVEALKALAPVVPEVPPLLESAPSWLIVPYYDNVLDYRRSSGRLLPLGVARQAILALEKVYDAGYALVDASIDNLLVDRREGLKLIDFEFCHRYEQQPESFSGSYDVAGCPADFSGDLPIQGGNSYDRNWRPYIGLSLDALLSDPDWLAHLKRGLYYLAHAHRFLPRLLRSYVQQWIGTRRPMPSLRLAGDAETGGESTRQRSDHRRAA